MTERRIAWGWVVLAAAGTFALTMGTRQSLALFIGPLNSATGLGLAAISLAFAIGQLAWGLTQPIAGALADRLGAGRVLAVGVGLVALGTALTPWMHSTAGLTLAVAVLGAGGAGMAGPAVLMATTTRLLPPERRPLATGIVNAGGSIGQFLMAPLAGWLLATVGWSAALPVMGAMVLLALPAAWVLRGAPAAPTAVAAPAAVATPPARAATTAVGQTAPAATAVRQTAPAATPVAQTAPAPAAPAPAVAPEVPGSPAGAATARAALRAAWAVPSFRLLTAGFFVCGFHVAFLATHLPGVVESCGLPPAYAAWSLAVLGLANIAGSLTMGWAMTRWRMKHLLTAVYALRALAVLVFLAAPKTGPVMLAFAAVMGFSFLSTVPPTAGLVARLCGVRHMAMLFGMVMLSHQVGGFLGVWIGGQVFQQTGAYDIVWWIDIALAVGAALLHLPIHEPDAPPRAAAAPA